MQIGLALLDLKWIFGNFQASMGARLSKTIIRSPVGLMQRIVKPIKVMLSLVLENTDS